MEREATSSYEAHERRKRIFERKFFFSYKQHLGLIENPDYPDDEATECTKPFLNKRWIAVYAVQWHHNAEFVNFALTRTLSYFFPSIMRNSYMEEMSGGNNYTTDTEEWMMNKLIVICFSKRIRDYVQKEVDYIYHSYTKAQLSIVRKWILFQNKDNYFTDGCDNSLIILDMEIRNE